MATKRAGIMTTSMVPSWGDGRFDFGIEATKTWSGKLGKPLVLDGDITSANHAAGAEYAVLEGLEKDAEKRSEKQREKGGEIWVTAGNYG
jgi:hypothetical protein